MPTVAALNWFERRAERAEFALDHVLAGVYAADLSVAAAPGAARAGSAQPAPAAR